MQWILDQREGRKALGSCAYDPSTRYQQIIPMTFLGAMSANGSLEHFSIVGLVVPAVPGFLRVEHGVTHQVSRNAHNELT